MAFLAPLAALLGIEVEALIARLRRNAMTYSVVALLAVIGLSFLLVAINVGLTELVGPLLAPLTIAAVAGASGLIVWLWSSGVEKRRQRLVAERRKASDTTALVTTAAVTALPLFMKSPALKVLAVPAGALLAYMLLGRRREDRGDA